MIPEPFFKVTRDFVADLLSTFPELEKTLDANLAAVHAGAANESECFVPLHQHVSTLGTKHIFDILAENASMFESECLLLPGVDFSVLWKENISDTTKATIWKYLKLLVMSAVGHGDFLDEAMQEKLKKDVQDFFGDPSGGVPPSPETMNDHLKGLVSGKLGDLAKEIASETMGGSPEEQMADFMKDPSKLCSLVQNVGGKIDEKIKSGELKESELIEEASAMLSKMKDMPGFDQILRKFTGGAKVDFAGMQTKFEQNAKTAKTKERLKKKLDARKKKAEA
jgi:hypothetical protein